MGKFIKIVVIIYIIYYALMFLFDLFIKKSKGAKTKDDGMVLNIEGFQTEEVTMTDEELAIEKKLQHDKDSFDDEEEDGGEEPEPVSYEDQSEGIEIGEIETQGFTVDELAVMMAEVHNESSDFMSRLDARSVEISNNPI